MILNILKYFIFKKIIFNCLFFQLDIDMFESYVDGKRFAIMEQTENRPLTSIFRIVLNHWPLLTRSARFVKPFINELEPNLILKGDSHHVCK
jgi:hypothetical protein